MKKIVLMIIMGLVLGIPSFSYAFLKTSRLESSFDEQISDQSAKQYSKPNSIAVVQVITPSQDYELDPSLWVSSLYYYSITRLGYLDIPFSYLVDNEGKIYEGRSGGSYVDAETVSKDGSVVIGYLSNDPEISFSASQSLKQIITELSYTYAITKKDVFAATINITKVGEVSKSALVKVSNEFTTSLSNIASQVTYATRENIKYKGEIKDVVYPASVKSGETFKVDLTIINKNDFPWITDVDPIYISTSNFRDSVFAVNGEWDSFSKPYTITDKTIMPNEEFKISFNMKALLVPGRYKQAFVFTSIPKNIFENTLFSISTTVKKGDYDLVKVVNIDFLNVRECPGPNCKIVSKVAENQVLISLEKANGWYKVKYTETKIGWVYGQYIQQL